MNNLVIIYNKLKQLKYLFNELLCILETEGDFEVNYAKSELLRNIQLIEAVSIDDSVELNKVLKDITENYQSMYPPRGGLTDFFIWRNDFDERFKANKSLDHIKNEISKVFDKK